MSSDNPDGKRSGLAGQIEVEIIREPESANGAPYLSSSTDPLSTLQELVEKAEELQQTSSECRLELFSLEQMRQQVARFQKQDSAFKKMLNRMLSKIN